MKDENDVMTNDAFIDFSTAERQMFVDRQLVSGGYYAPVKENSLFRVSGNRYAGSKTPDSVRDKWATPKEVIDWLTKRYGAYDLDAAASKDNAVCEHFYTEEINCLKRWFGTKKHVWLNPPYSNPDPFVKKAIEQMEHDNQIDVLLPGDNSTAWFTEAQRHAAEIIWIIGDLYEEDGREYCRSGRLAFISAMTGEAVSGNNKGSVIFIMRKLNDGEKQLTHYVNVSEICPSVKNKRARARNV